MKNIESNKRNKNTVTLDNESKTLSKIKEMKSNKNTSDNWLDDISDKLDWPCEETPRFTDEEIKILDTQCKALIDDRDIYLMRGIDQNEFSKLREKHEKEIDSWSLEWLNTFNYHANVQALLLRDWYPMDDIIHLHVVKTEGKTGVVIWGENIKLKWKTGTINVDAAKWKNLKAYEYISNTYHIEGNNIVLDATGRKYPFS